MTRYSRRTTVRCHADAHQCGLIMPVREYDEYQAEQPSEERRAP
jgi:hypothetical protein